MTRLTLTRRQTLLAGVGAATTAAACAVNGQAAGEPLKYPVPQPGWLWKKRKLDAHTDFSERFSRRDKVIIYGADAEDQPGLSVGCDNIGGGKLAIPVKTTPFLQY